MKKNSSYQIVEFIRKLERFDTYKISAIVALISSFLILNKVSSLISPLLIGNDVLGLQHQNIIDWVIFIVLIVILFLFLNWLLKPSDIISETILNHPENIVWVYGKQKLIFYFGFIPIPSGYSIMICTNDNEKHEIFARRSFKDLFFNYIKENMPNTVLGYNKALHRIYKNSPEDFAKIFQSEGISAKAD